MVAPAIFIENSCVQEGGEANITEEISTVDSKESHEAILPVDLKENVTNGYTKPIDTREVGEASMILAKQTSNKHACPKSPFHKGKIHFFCIFSTSKPHESCLSSI